MKSIRILLLLVLIQAGCDKPKQPEVRLLNDRFMTGNVDIVPGGVLRFKWMAEKGKSDLSSFTIRVNGEDHPGFPWSPIPADIYVDSIFMEGPVAAGDHIFSFLAFDVDGKFGEKYIVVSVRQ